MPDPGYEEFLPRLIGDDPRWRPLLDEHLDDNEGEVIPTLLMWDLRKWAVEHVATDPAGVDLLLSRLVDAFGSGQGDVADCVSLSFLEGLPRGSEPGAAVRSRLPRVLADDLAAMEAWRP